MSKLSRFIVVPLLALAASAGAGVGVAEAAILGPDAAACEPGANGPALIVRIDGFKNRTGDIRLQVYGDNPSDFLAKGRKLKRIELPVTRAGEMRVCVALPHPGNYAVAVRHDADGDGKSGSSDGGGFSRNPGLSLISLKPKYKDVVISVGAQPKQIDVVLNYVQGLSIKPVKTAAR